MQKDANILSPLDEVKEHRRPLIDKLNALSQEPAPFAAAHARITGYLARLKKSKDLSLLTLRTELPRIVDPVDFFNEKAREQLCRAPILHQNDEALTPLNTLIEQLTKIEIDTELQYPTLTADLKTLVQTYENFRFQLLNTSLEERTKIFIPTANVVGECIGFGTLSTALGGKLLCRDPWGQETKSNSYGIHSVVQHDGVFYKPNPHMNEGLENSFINPGMEHAVVCLLQLIAGDLEVAAPSALIKVRHVVKHDHNDCAIGYMERAIQAGLGVAGISLQDLLSTVMLAKQLHEHVQAQELEQFYEAIFNTESIVTNFMKANPALNAYYDLPRPAKHHSYDDEIKHGIQRDILPLVRMIFRHFPHLKESNKISHLACFFTEDTDKQFYQIQKWLDMNIGTFKILIHTMALMEHLTFLLEHYSFDDLLNIVACFSQNLNKIFKVKNVKFAVNNLHILFSLLDADHYSASVIGHLLAHPSDAKADNFQVRLFYDIDTNELIKIQIVGIDNDRALSHPLDYTKKKFHNMKVKCILFCFDEMNLPVSPKIKQRLLSRSPMEWLLDWLKLIYEHSLQIKAMIDQQVLDNSDIVQKNHDKIPVSLIDIPLLLDPTILSYLYNQLRILLQALTSNNVKLNDLFSVMQPILSMCYNKILSKVPDIQKAFSEIYNGPPIEQLFKEYFSDPLEVEKLKKQLPNANSYKHSDPKKGRILTIPKAICKFFSDFDWDGLSPREQLNILDRLGMYFPSLNVLSARTDEWKVKKLHECILQTLPNAIGLLITAGAPVTHTDATGQTLLHILFGRAHGNEPEKIIATLDVLLSQSTLDVNIFDNHGTFPLKMVIQHFNESTAKAILLRLFHRGVNLELTDRISGDSALDYAIECNKPLFFLALLELGAGKRVRVDSAFAFINNYRQDESLRSAIEEAHYLLTQNNSEYNYRTTLSAICSSAPETGSLLIQGSQCGNVFLRKECLRQLLDEEAAFPKKLDMQKMRSTGVTIQAIQDGKAYSMRLEKHPELPGMEAAAGTLRRQLIGHGAPYTELFKFTDHSGLTYPVLLSKAIDCVKNLADALEDSQASAEILPKLDHRSISEMIVTSLLINPANDQPENFVVQLMSSPDQPLYRLLCVDNGHGFVDALTKDSTNRTKLSVKSIIYCLDDMHRSIHTRAIDHFLSLDPEQVLREWLQTLFIQDESHQTLFNAKERKRLLSLRLNRPLAVEVARKKNKDIAKTERDLINDPQTLTIIQMVQIKPELIATLYNKILSIQKAFKENPYITGLQLLIAVIPEIGLLYEDSFRHYRTPLERFKSLTNTSYSESAASRLNRGLSTPHASGSWIVSSSSMSGETLNDTIGPKPALIMLKMIHTQSIELEATLSDLHRGQFKRFRDLRLPFHKEQIVNKIDWKILASSAPLKSDNHAPAYVMAQLICNEKISFQHLKLSHCTVLSKEQLITLLKHSPDLSLLDLSYCPIVDTSTIHLIEKYCSNLEVLILQGTMLTEFSITHLPRVHTIILQDCLRLGNIRIRFPRSMPHPSLRALLVDGSKSLTAINLNTAILRHFSCEKIDIQCIIQIKIKAREKSSIIIESLTRQIQKNYKQEVKVRIEGEENYKAIPIFEKLIMARLDASPLSGALYEALSHLNFKNKRFEIALDHINKALDLLPAPCKATAVLLNGKIKYQLAQHKFDTDVFKGPILSANNSIDSLSKNVIIESVEAKKLLSEATNELTRAIELDSSLASAFKYRGLCKYNLSFFKAAIIDLTASVNINPNSKSSRLKRIECNEKLENHTEILKDCSHLIRLKPSSAQEYVRRGLVNIRLSNDLQALDDLNQALQLDPNNLEALKLLANLHYLLDNIVESLHLCNRILALHSSSSIAYYFRAKCKHKQKDYQGALSDFDLSLRNTTENEVDIHLSRGLCFLEMEKTENALAEFAQGLRYDPNNSLLYQHAGSCKMKFQKFDDALRDFNRAIKISPFQSTIYVMRGACYIKCANLAQALIDLTKAIELDPNEAEAYQHRAQCNFELNEPEKALFDITRAKNIKPDDKEISLLHEKISSRILYEKGADNSQVYL